MAKNFVQPGKTITLNAPYQRNSGEGALVGTIFGVALQTVANAVDGEFMIEGVWDLAKVSAQAWTQGALIYWDNTAKLATNVATSNTRIGVAMRIEANPTATGRVRLDGVAHVSGVA